MADHTSASDAAGARRPVFARRNGSPPRAHVEATNFSPKKQNLTEDEFRWAVHIGTERHMQNLKLGTRARYGASDAWSHHIEGACGECAFARYLGKFWSGALGNWRSDDVGCYQVRTSSKSDGDLILHPGDPDDRIFVLVTGLAPNFLIVGWILAYEGKCQRWWRDPVGGRPAFFVPQSHLQPMEELPR